jgi:hypothetical protein
VENAAAVRRFQGACDLERQWQCLFGRHRSPWGLAVDVLEHQIPGADVVKLADVRMIQRSDRACFIFESTQPVWAGGNFLRKDLECDVSPQACIACAIHLAL